MKMNRKLGKHALEEIRETIRNARNSAEISAHTESLATHYRVSKSAIYEVTKDLRPKRASRSDKGKRTIDFDDERMKFVGGLIVEYNIKPEEAMKTAKERGMELPIELPTLQRYLREHGLNKEKRRKNMSAHRRFEAAAPGELFQFDMSGLKERWYDIKKRKIVSVSSLEVSKNHENEVATRVKIWRFALLDDHSRRIFCRYVAVDKANSSHVVDFLLEAYSELGVPRIMYTDNDSIIKFQRNKVTSEILHKALESEGGYQLLHHLPGNSRATGKIERLHQIIEEYEKGIGVLLAEGRELTLDVLNQKLAPNICQTYNHKVHRTTGQTPDERWNATRSVVRRVDYELLKSIFLADEFEPTINGDLTVTHRGKVYQLPTSDTLENGESSPFSSWIGAKVKIFISDEADFFTLFGLDGNEYDITKQLASADIAGEFKSATDKSQQLRKDLKKFAKENAKAEKENNRIGFLPKPIATIDTVPEVVKNDKLLTFPKREIAVTPEMIAEVAPDRVRQTKSNLIKFWDAFTEFKGNFAESAECKTFLDGIFPDRESSIPKSEIETALETRAQTTKPTRLLRAV